MIPSENLRAVELLASPVADGPVTKPDEPRSFLDVDSDDSSEDERQYSQSVVSRASSVRMQRPKLVENYSGDQSSHIGSLATIQVYNGDLLMPRVAPKPNARPMSTHEEDVEHSQPEPKTPATEITNESTRGMGPEHAYKELTANAPSPQFISHFSATTVDSPLPIGVDTPFQTPLSKAEDVDTTTGLGPKAALRALTGENDNASTTALAPTPKSQDAVSTQARDEAGLVLFSSAIKESAVEVPRTFTVQRTLPSRLDAFGSSFNSAVVGTADRLSPLSLNPVDTNAARVHRTISAPPLPHQNPNRKVTIRPSDLVIAGSWGDHQLFRDEVVSTPYPTRKGSITNPEDAFAKKRGVVTLSEGKDRFPSPDRAEVLVLQLAIAQHAGSKKTVVIEITDKGTFNDHHLFKNIRKAYSTDLLGPLRRVFSARQLSHATFSNDLSFNSEDFIRHLKQSKNGRKRKASLIWLRQHQPVVSDSLQDHDHDSRASYYSPSSIPRMPFQSSPLQPPKVVLHFEFSILAIGLAVLACLVLSCLATMLWVLFGVPDFDVGSVGSIISPERNWRLDAEGRVLVGLVLGIFVLFLTSLGSAMWIGGSYVLL